MSGYPYALEKALSVPHLSRIDRRVLSTLAAFAHGPGPEWSVSIPQTDLLLLTDLHPQELELGLRHLAADQLLQVRQSGEHLNCRIRL